MHDKNKTKYITNTPVKEKACRRMSRKDYQQNDKKYIKGKKVKYNQLI